MKVGILAGGVGSRLSEETTVKPKPMVEIGGRPILWHIMKYYATYGFSEFVVALGYKGEQIKRYMADYCALASDLRISLADGQVKPVDNGNGHAPNWVVDLIDTGQGTNTGGRIKRLAPHLGTGTFMLTWGDGVSTVEPERPARVPSQPRSPRDRDGGASALALRAPGDGRRPRHPLR